MQYAITLRDASSGSVFSFSVEDTSKDMLVAAKQLLPAQAGELTRQTGTGRAFMVVDEFCRVGEKKRFSVLASHPTQPLEERLQMAVDDEEADFLVRWQMALENGRTPVVDRFERFAGYMSACTVRSVSLAKPDPLEALRKVVEAGHDGEGLAAAIEEAREVLDAHGIVVAIPSVRAFGA